MHYVLNVTAGGLGLVLSGIFTKEPVLTKVFLSIGTLGVIGSMPLFWPIPPAFLVGTAAAVGIGMVNFFGNLDDYVSSNLPVWAKKVISTDPSAALYVIAAVLFLGALMTFLFIPADLRSKRSAPGRIAESPA